MTVARITRRTYLWSAALIAVVAAVWSAVALRLGGEDVAVAVSDLGSVASVGLAGVICLLTAYSFERGERVRTAWSVIGSGVIVFALGDIVWSYYELSVGEVPYPGLPDFFYLLSPILVGLGIVWYAAGFRHFVGWKRPALITWIADAVGLIAVWLLILGPSVFSDPEISLAEKIVSSAYPVLDVVAIIGPAVYLIATIAVMGRGRLAWPWWSVGAGAVLLAVSDSAFAVLQASDAYFFGHPVDFGWMIGFALLAIGALVQRDVLEA